MRAYDDTTPHQEYERLPYSYYDNEPCRGDFGDCGIGSPFGDEFIKRVYPDEWEHREQIRKKFDNLDTCRIETRDASDPIYVPYPAKRLETVCVNAWGHVYWKNVITTLWNGQVLKTTRVYY
ncbi:MAG: hypothetical protein II964_00755 [Synergistaceae bacterium]|nr:hypothetical protein [Synergistaceae bacterium]